MQLLHTLFKSSAATILLVNLLVFVLTVTSDKKSNKKVPREELYSEITRLKQEIVGEAGTVALIYRNPKPNHLFCSILSHTEILSLNLFTQFVLIHSFVHSLINSLILSLIH